MRHAHNRNLTRPTVIGRTRNGRPVWSIAGGADDDSGQDGDGTGTDDTDDSDDSGEDDDEDPEGADKLGDPGKQALDRMKEERKQLRADLKAYRAIGKTPSEIQELLAAQRQAIRDTATGDDDDQPDAEALRKQIRDEVKAEVDAEAARDRALDKLEAKAARRFKNPDLARKLLADQAEDFLDDKGKPDVEAITEALDELLEEEPYLAVSATQPAGSGDARSRSEDRQGDVTKMTPAQVREWAKANR